MIPATIVMPLNSMNIRMIEPLSTVRKPVKCHQKESVQKEVIKNL